jgi:hypothetical protein
VLLLLSCAGLWVAESFLPTWRNAGGFCFSAKEQQITPRRGQGRAKQISIHEEN